MKEIIENKYIIDDRCGCAAILDTETEAFQERKDGIINGLHSDDPDVVFYVNHENLSSHKGYPVKYFEAMSRLYAEMHRLATGDELPKEIAAMEKQPELTKEKDADIKDHNIAILNEACRILSCVPGYLIKNIEGLMKTNKEYAEVIASNNIKKHEKQPTEYEYVQLTESDFDVWDLKGLLEGGELFSKRSDGKYTQYSDRSPLYMLMHFNEYGVYRRIEPTPEQLHERKVEELSKVIKAGNPIGQDIKYHEMSSTHLDAYVSMARSALEWMESKGR